MLDGMTGTLSIYTVVNSARQSQHRCAAFAKQAAVLCDHLFVDPFGLGPHGVDVPGSWGANGPTDLQERLALIHIAGPDESDVITRRAFRDLIVLPYELDDEDRIAEAMHTAGMLDATHYAAVDLVESFSDEELAELGLPPRSEDYKGRGALAIEIARDLGVPSAVTRWIEYPVGLVTPMHTEVFRSTKSPSEGSQTGGAQRVLQELVSNGAVDFGAMSWDEVLRLRKSRFREDFRAKLDEIARSAPIDSSQALWNDLWRITRESVPSTRQTMMGGLLGNIPFLPINPIAVVTAVAALERDVERSHEFGWLYFLLEANPFLG